jgi:hypothetical protein
MSDTASCFHCFEDTGKAGRGEDSFYDEQGHGPYCDDCRDLWIGFSQEVRKATNDCWRMLEGRTGLRKPDVGGPKIDMASLVQRAIDAATEELRAENAKLLAAGNAIIDVADECSEYCECEGGGMDDRYDVLNNRIIAWYVLTDKKQIAVPHE